MNAGLTKSRQLPHAAADKLPPVACVRSVAGRRLPDNDRDDESEKNRLRSRGQRALSDSLATVRFLTRYFSPATGRITGQLTGEVKQMCGWCVIGGHRVAGGSLINAKTTKKQTLNERRRVKDHWRPRDWHRSLYRRRRSGSDRDSAANHGCKFHCPLAFIASVQTTASCVEMSYSLT